MGERLKGKIALVTGGGTGIGAATARRFAAEGATVVVCGRRKAPLEGVAAEIDAAGGRCEAEPADVSDEGAFVSLIDRIVARHGRLDVLVNGAFFLKAGPIEAMSLEDWRASFRTTLDATFVGTRKALEVMGRQGGGSVVNISSTAGQAGQPSLAGYSASKAALDNFSMTAACEGAARGVRVNVVAPGVIATENTLAAFADPRARSAMERLVPMGRFGRPEEIANAIVFLASDESSFVTGAVLIADGGQRAAIGAPALDESFEVA